MDVGVATKKNERKRDKHKSHQSGSKSPQYFRGFLGEIWMMGSKARDSFGGLNEALRVPETQHDPHVPSIEALRSASPNIETSTQVNVK
jgi:hypothetical protein